MKTWQAGRDALLLEDVKNGTKTIEGRLCRDQYKKYKIGDRVNLRADYYNDANILVRQAPDQVLIEITDLQRFCSLKEMLEQLGFKKFIPGANSIEEALQVYRRFYLPEEENRYGALAIHFKVL
jgi:ASC-1-like (ASCH) protein